MLDPGDIAPSRSRDANADADDENTVSPTAAAALRRSICERLMGSSFSFAQNSSY